MIFFLTVIIVANIIIILLNQFFFVGIDLLWLNVLAVTGGTLLMIASDGLIAHICHKNQHKIDPFSKFFGVTEKQKNIIAKTGVKHYKKYLPDLGKLVKFPKGKIVDPKSPEYVYTYIVESASGELGHLIGAFVGLLYIPVFAFEPIYMLTLGLPVAGVNSVLCVLPVLALRYNRYALGLIYKRLIAKTQKPS